MSSKHLASSMFEVRETTLVVFVLVCVSIGGWADDGGGSATVYTEDGALSGTEYTTVGGRKVTAFLGVPYARPPVGGLRFKEPQPAEKWTGIRSASKFSSRCVQLTLHKLYPERILGEEDCLFLNVFTPAAANNSKLNVIFFIHGGAYMYGGSDIFKPDIILDHFDVVYVSINYRLGPFGFLSTEDGVIPGNNGLKDQVLALKWVQNNIEQFGGDRSKVTIAGFSAGGASVHLHYLSPLSKVLFHRGISMSASALCPWVSTENAKLKAYELASSVGCPTNNSKSLLKCLQQKNARLILSKIEKLFLAWDDNPFSPFGLVVERNAGVSAFLDKTPSEILAEGNVKDAPWLVSVSADEGIYPAGSFLKNDNLMEELNNNWNNLSPHLLDYNNTVAPVNLNYVSKSIREYYLGDKGINSNNSKELIKLLSDRLYLVGIERSARLQAHATSSPVYFYNFDYRGKYSTTEFTCKCKDDFGVSHGDDLMYLIYTGWPPIETDDDKAMLKTMVNIWRSFVETGVPTVGYDSMWTPVSHDALDRGNMSYMLISSSTDIQLKSSSDLSNRKFWDKLPFLDD